MAQLALFNYEKGDVFREWVVIDTQDLDSAELMEEYGYPGVKLEGVIPVTHGSLTAWPTDRALSD